MQSELTGEWVPINSEEWLLECQAAFLLALPRQQRDIMLEGTPGGVGYQIGIRGMRGDAVVAELRAAVDRLAAVRGSK